MLVNFLNYLRTLFSFMSLTVFRPECEFSIPYIAQWTLRIAMPVALIYLVWVVSALHSIIASYAFSRNRRFPNASLNIAMCELGVCPSFVSHYLRDPVTMQFRFMCDVCAISHKYRPVLYTENVDAMKMDAHVDPPSLRAFPLPPGLTFGTMSLSQTLRFVCALYHVCNYASWMCVCACACYMCMCVAM